jgi:hypothetical protein
MCCQSPSEKSAAYVHLPESFLGVEIALGHEEIMLAGSKNMRDSVWSPKNSDFLV